MRLGRREESGWLWRWGWKQPLKISWNIPKNMALSEGEGGRWWIVDVGVEVALSSQSASVAPTSQTLLAAGRLWPTKTNSCQQLLKKSQALPWSQITHILTLKWHFFQNIKESFLFFTLKIWYLVRTFCRKIKLPLTKKLVILLLAKSDCWLFWWSSAVIKIATEQSANHYKFHTIWGKWTFANLIF